MAADPTPPRRRRLAFSLRAGLLVVLVVGVILGWRTHRARVQRRSIEAIRAAGGLASFRYAMFGAEFLSDDAPKPAKWLMRVLGDEYVREIGAVDLPPDQDLSGLAGPLGDADRLQALHAGRIRGADAVLSRLPGSVRTFNLTATDVSDAGLAPLERMAGLEAIHLMRTGIGDAGLAHLPRGARVDDLRLDETRVTDAGLAHLRRLGGLKHLSLEGLSITGAGLDHLAGVAGLASLNLGETRLSEADLGHLAGLKELTGLDLSGSAVTDAGLGHLAGLPRLESLSLADTGVTDAGIGQLLRLTRLESLDLSRTRVTAAGIGRLNGLPGLKQLWLMGRQQHTPAEVAEIKRSLPATDVTAL